MFALIVEELESPPSRRRGLKSYDDIGTQFTEIVASFAEAWIEKINKEGRKKEKRVASFAEAWIENFTASMFSCIVLCRLFRGGVD